MIRSALCLALALGLGASSAWAQEGGLPKPDPRARPRQSVLWSAPSAWEPLPLRPGEFAAWRVARASAEDAPGKDVLKGPRAALYYLGRLDEARALAGRRRAWARRFRDAEQARLAPEAAKLTRLPEPAEGAPPPPPKGPLEVHLVQVLGDYSAPLSPGEEAQPPRKEWAGVFGHVVGPDGVWVLEVVGPRAEVAPWLRDLKAFLTSAKAGEALRGPDPREAAAAPPSSPGDKKAEPRGGDEERGAEGDEDDREDDAPRPSQDR